jgi:hypothetical protein
MKAAGSIPDYIVGSLNSPSTSSLIMVPGSTQLVTDTIKGGRPIGLTTSMPFASRFFIKYWNLDVSYKYGRLQLKEVV